MTLNYHLGDISGRTQETVFSAPQGSYVTTTEEIRSGWVSIVTTTYRFWAHRSDRDDIVLILIEFPPVFFQIAARGCRYHSSVDSLLGMNEVPCSTPSITNKTKQNGH